MLKDGKGKLDYAKRISKKSYDKLLKEKAKQEFDSNVKATKTREFIASLPKGKDSDETKEIIDAGLKFRQTKEYYANREVDIFLEKNKKERFKVSKIGRERSYFYKWHTDLDDYPIIDDRFSYDDTGKPRKVIAEDYKKHGEGLSNLKPLNRKERRQGIPAIV